ncbi:hypothetical protein dqs_0178 [Azoarcus olearius]|uniref:DUF3617 domain-containing protein n=1 Tax=Azoarcus sp. (strain BH72) TaxID=418699 RepID=UPI0008062E48|nr:DUF3617 family protein [Azoarcus olearius]ANQ83261.1 hypothetical protein dqs_0178 [Azoarcus olearius]
MQRRLSILAGALAALVAAPTLAEPPADMPRRKPGLWEMKTTLVELGGLTQMLQMCVGPNTDDILYQRGGKQGGCEQQTWRREGERSTFSAVCRIEGSLANLRGSFTGDFTTRYSGELYSTYNPPLQGMASMTMRQDSRWLGECQPGQKPGDIVRQGVGGIDLDAMMKGMQRR